MRVRALALDISEIDGEAEAGDNEKLGDARSANHHAGRQQIELRAAPDLGKLRPCRFSPLLERRFTVPWRCRTRRDGFVVFAA